MVTTVLRVAAAAVCVGTGLSGLFYDFPLRTLLWDQSSWSWFAERAGYSWVEWVTDPTVDRLIDSAGRWLGVFLSVGGLLLLYYRPTRWLTWTVTILLLLLQFLTWKNHFFRIGRLLEGCLQTGGPLLYYWWVRLSPGPSARERGDVAASGNRIAKLDAYWWAVRLFVALTFTGHGLYAIGYYPVPAHFVLMTQSGLGVGEETARHLLAGVGFLDFLAAVALLLPYRPAVKTALCWVIPWAILTTLARLWSYGGLVAFDTLVGQWLPEVVRRLPHVLVPVALWGAVTTCNSAPACAPARCKNP